MNELHIDEKQLLLWALDELSVPERTQIQGHIAQCEKCRQALDRQSTFLRTINTYPHPLPTDALIQSSRRTLRKSMAEEAEKTSIKDRLADFWERLLFPSPAPRLAAAAALLVIGVFVGRFMTNHSIDLPRPGDGVASLNTAGPVSRFKVIPTGQSDEIEIRFETVKEITIKGSLQDPDIQSALAYALVNESRDNIRLKSVKLLQDAAQDEHVQSALIHAAGHDENPGIRLKAVRLLSGLPMNDNIKQMLISALFRDENRGVRTQAANALTLSPDKDILPILEKQARTDEYIQSLIARMQQNNNETNSIKL